MDDNKKFGDVSQEDIDKAKKAAPDDLKEKQPVNVMDEVFEWAESFVFAMFVVILIQRERLRQSPKKDKAAICRGMMTLP